MGNKSGKFVIPKEKCLLSIINNKYLVEIINNYLDQLKFIPELIENTKEIYNFMTNRHLQKQIIYISSGIRPIPKYYRALKIKHTGKWMIHYELFIKKNRSCFD